MMRAERGRATPPELPKKRARKKKEAPVEMEGLTDVSELRAQPANETADRESGVVDKGDTAKMLTKRIEDMAAQKEVNLKNPALSESMAKKINAEIDRNIDELAAKRDELEGVVTSAAPLEKITTKRNGKEKPSASRGPRKAGEAPRTYEEHKADLEAAFDNLEREANRDTLVDLEMPAKMEKAAEEDESVDVDLTEMNAEAEEDAFFNRGERISAAHERGEELEATETEKLGQRRQERHEGRSREMSLLEERAELLRAELPGLQNAVIAAERRLHREFGVEDADAEMMKRATSGWENVKSFFGGLFSKKEQRKNSAFDDYRRLRDRFSSRQEELNETENRLQRPEDVRQAMQVKGERRKP